VVVWRVVDSANERPHGGAQEAAAALEPSVYDAIAKWAADDLRSVNAQIEYALRRALRSAGREPRPRESDERERNGPAEPGGPGQ
jgi:hypothetical protein